MAHWKRLTGTDGYHVDVNMNSVAYMHGLKDHTVIAFVGGRSTEGKVMIITVKEKPETIHSMTPLHST